MELFGAVILMIIGIIAAAVIINCIDKYTDLLKVETEMMIKFDKMLDPIGKYYEKIMNEYDD